MDSFSSAILRPFLANLILVVNETFLPLQGPDTEAQTWSSHQPAYLVVSYQ